MIVALLSTTIIRIVSSNIPSLVVTSHCCSIPSGATATGSASGSARTGAGRQEPGTSSGARISGFTVSPAPQRGDNLTRLGPLSSPCRAGNVKILRGAWSVELFRILEGFPDLAHDDEVDASSGSLEILNLQMRNWGPKKPIAYRQQAEHLRVKKGRLMRRQPKAQTLAPLAGNRGFESTSLRRGVSCEPDFLDQGARHQATVRQRVGGCDLGREPRRVVER